ncbi:predicted protein [Thalassiosira pseudonana CCMP1335]|uniref:Uncharacterized protein n=1 Tax=Thalassiosira pseudonana TaxID=35128 RepID=B8CAI2_THAPS|nr:predicted protein [Thalassiosira pseudonana CCMP1335]EED89512.1 predicted protein [Thalassiosira pseudonana CCMP1335]
MGTAIQVPLQLEQAARLEEEQHVVLVVGAVGGGVDLDVGGGDDWDVGLGVTLTLPSPRSKIWSDKSIVSAAPTIDRGRRKAANAEKMFMVGWDVDIDKRVREESLAEDSRQISVARKNHLSFDSTTDSDENRLLGTSIRSTSKETEDAVTAVSLQPPTNPKNTSSSTRNEQQRHELTLSTVAEDTNNHSSKRGSLLKLVRLKQDNDANATATEPQHEVLALKKLISPVSSVENEYSVIDSAGVVNVAAWKDIHAQDDATTTGATLPTSANQINSSISPSLASKQRQIREKEAEIELKKGALAEVARLNRKKEQEINERLAALDAATAALLERANNVQQVINQRLALRYSGRKWKTTGQLRGFITIPFRKRNHHPPYTCRLS